MKLPATIDLRVRSMGKDFRVDYIEVGADAANAVMEKHDAQALIAEVGDLCFLADKYAPGQRIGPA